MVELILAALGVIWTGAFLVSAAAFGVVWLVRRLSRRTAHDDREAIVDALGDEELSTAEISKATGLVPPELTVALFRLERDRRIASRWADGPQPRLRLYRAVPYR